MTTSVYNPYLPEPQLHSVMQRPNAQQPPGLMPNGWEPLSIAPSSRAVIPGVSTNAVGKNYRVSHKIGMGSFGEIFLGPPTCMRAKSGVSEECEVGRRSH
jgi:hypothetical protein